MSNKISIVRATVDLGYNSNPDSYVFLVTLYTPTFYEKLALAEELRKLNYLTNVSCNDLIFNDPIYFGTRKINCNLLGSLKRGYRLLCDNNEESIQNCIENYFRKQSHIYYYIDVYCPKKYRSLFSKNLKTILDKLNTVLLDRSENDEVVNDYLNFLNKRYTVDEYI